MKEIKVVAAVIQNEHKEYLCCQRAENKSLAGYWEFPGGKIEINETAELALKREIKEELNANCNIKKFLGTTMYEYEFGRVILNVYLCNLEEGKFNLIEHQDSKWLNKQNLANLKLAPADIPILNWL
ncbi:(deoxy)nucleoside triphosphate pyrophosphohydrolase [Mammaliicoccus lentus]|uniref:(deoxy)nucleoside triphosphate pyrophosphohydrolase n=1 Tax=Mammaliicoccus lentus TaxID=42858 RepID=UPI00214B79B1|nr:(deoxy)nucleoside triphosphate pyrophosphohydrolase [Mammaliicoccus lentus]MCR1873622.1 (deoxy)nucleoside triphosphate pyrophosphohydrolase [Mammaliicoccus lentus]